MKTTKYRAFTLAEVMILLFTLSLLMAAFAPVMTKRNVVVSTESPWNYVQGSSRSDGYFDNIGVEKPAQVFFGITVKKEKADSDNAVNNKQYSKVVLRARKNQYQIQFRESGTLIGGLYTDTNKNFLFGGKYSKKPIPDKEEDKPIGNTAFGVGALGGNQQLKNVSYNTAVGYRAGYEIKENSIGNTLVGSNAGYRINSSYNTIIGYNSGKNLPYINDRLPGSGNVAIGDNILTNDNIKYAEYNVGIGSGALKNAGGNVIGNVAIGKNALGNLSSGGLYNVAIGSYAEKKRDTTSNDLFNAITTGSYNTFINSGSYDGYMDYQTSISFTPNNSSYSIGDEIYIGNFNNNGANTPVIRIQNPGPAGEYKESVIINGNLVVRGASYFEAPVNRSSTKGKNYPSGLIRYEFLSGYVGANTGTYYAGLDGGSNKDTSFNNKDGKGGYISANHNCICTSAGLNSNGKADLTNYDIALSSFNKPFQSTSYDWVSKAVGKRYGDGSGPTYDLIIPGQFYYDISLGKYYQFYGDENNTGNNYWYDVSYSHMEDGASCCPDLSSNTSYDINDVFTQGNDGSWSIKSSDRRLKDIGDKFTAGLNELKRIKVYNFTFKNDSKKTPHVGVVAQDLKRIFPNSVKKDKNGFYQIRWDEMFYAVINSIKELDERINKISAKITENKSKVSKLKQDNAELNKQLDKLEAEIKELEEDL